MSSSLSASGLWGLGFAAYVAGVIWGLLKIDARGGERLVLALLWPLGPLAFVVTVTVLIAASVIAFPRVMVPLLAALVAVVWWIF